MVTYELYETSMMYLVQFLVISDLRIYFVISLKLKIFV